MSIRMPLVAKCRMLVALSLLAMSATLPVTGLADEPPPGAAGSAELAKRMAARAEIKLRAALAEATSLEFIETPLKDVVDFLKDLHAIEIQIDTKALDGARVSADTPVTRNLKGVSLRSALSLMLKEFGLTFMIKDEVLQITTSEFVERHVTIKTYAVADIATDAPSGAALTTAVELALTPTAEASETPEAPKPRPEASRVVMLRGVLIVRGNPVEHERIEDLLNQLRRQLKLDDKQAARPLQ